MGVAPEPFPPGQGPGQIFFTKGGLSGQPASVPTLKQASPAYVHLGRKSRPSTNPEGKPNLEHEVANLREVAAEVRKTAKA